MGDVEKEEVLEAVAGLHRSVDALAQQLSDFHAPRMQCGRGCSGCCVDDLRVFEVEAAQIRARHPEVLKTAAHPQGACAFLDEAGACRIYPSRPYVCRSQGLPLRWIDEEAGVEHRDICELNEPGGPPLVELKTGHCWTLGPAEGKLQQIQGASDRSMPRVALRDLFDNDPAS